MIAVIGAPIVYLVYACTIVGLCLAYLIGRLIPERKLISLLKDIGLSKFATNLDDMNRLPISGRTEFLRSQISNRFLRVLLKYKYFSLALLINLPGNFLVGGGGGIAMSCGASRLYSFPLYLITIAIAVSPLPIAILIFGVMIPV